MSETLGAHSAPQKWVLTMRDNRKVKVNGKLMVTEGVAFFRVTVDGKLAAVRAFPLDVIHEMASST